MFRGFIRWERNVSRQLSFYRRVKPLEKNDALPLNDSPDVFGTLSPRRIQEKTIELMPEEEGDKTEINFLDGIEGKTRLSTKRYADMIKLCVREKRISDAIDVLESRMIKQDRVQPENYIYNLLIGACARVGYTKKSFQLYNQMKKRGLKVTGGTYTSLFNACANSPWKSDGLERATHLRDLMLERGYSPNQSNYHSMMKAFGWCGDVETAFSLVDEMYENKVWVSTATFNFLLQACASDKEAGFRHALLVWRKLRDKKIKPSIYTYNMLLRCIRDCGLGEESTMNEEIQRIAGSNQGEQKRLSPQETEDRVSRTNENTALTLSVAPLPNLLAVKPHMGTVTQVQAITKPEHRLMLVGGCEGFLEEMLSDNVMPDIKTITQLLNVIPQNLDSEMVLLTVIEKQGIEMDIDFCNMLIKKRVFRNDPKAAKEVLELINSKRLSPDIVTFGVLALACRSLEEVKKLIQDIEEAGYRINIEIIGSLVYSAAKNWKVGTMVFLMRKVIDEGLKPNDKLLDHLKRFHDSVQAEIRIKENGAKAKTKVYDQKFLEAFRMFCYSYKDWKKEITVDDSDKVHPYKQFKKRSETVGGE